MADLDPFLLQTFREKVAQPKYWASVFEILRVLEPEDVKDSTGVGQVIDKLSKALEIKLTPEQRANAVDWIVSQQLNPKNPADTLRLWQLVFGKQQS